MKTWYALLIGFVFFVAALMFSGCDTSGEMLSATDAGNDGAAVVPICATDVTRGDGYTYCPAGTNGQTPTIALPNESQRVPVAQCTRVADTGFKMTFVDCEFADETVQHVWCVHWCPPGDIL